MVNKPWLKYYDAGVPAHLDYPDSLIQDFLIQQAQKHPSRIALVCEKTAISYQELYEKANFFAKRLVNLGVQPGDRVAICLPNSIEFVVAFFGTLMAGGVVAAMNPIYPYPEWRYQGEIARPCILVGPKSRQDDLQRLQTEAGIIDLILVDLSVMGSCRIEGFSSPKSADEGKTRFQLQQEMELPRLITEHPAVLQFSGGTTGSPKAAMALHRNVVANILQFKNWLTTMKEGEEVFLTAIPLYHVYGMVIGLNVGIAMGATLVLVPDARDLDTLLNLAEEHAVTFFPGVPSMYNAIAHNPRALAGKVSLHSIKACISGSAPLHRETRLQFEKLTGGKLVEGYGLSEAPTATHCNPLQGENRDGSIGLPLPDVECRIMDLEEEEKEVPIGGTGELQIRSPQVMQGYFGSQEETAIALQGSWLRTGDIAKMDEDGYFYISGRCKDLIKVNGLQVWPVEVENVLVQFPGIREAAVAGVPDDVTGEAVYAWLVVDGTKLDHEKLNEFCRRYLASYKIPKGIQIIEKLPRSPVGKLLRRELVADFTSKKKTGA